MCAARRLSSEERKMEIMQAAAKIITSKGFSSTTMEDVIAGTSMSKGGVYHYYRNTVEILHDLMIAGIEYRTKVIREPITEYQAGDEVDFWARQLFEKLVDDNPYMSLYVQFLIEKKRKPELEALFNTLKEQTREDMMQVIKPLPAAFLHTASFELLTHFINAMILASDVLDARESFRNNRALLEEMLILLLKQGKELEKDEL